MEGDLEAAACIPAPVSREGFNPTAELPYGCTTKHLFLAMTELVDFLGFIHQQLSTRQIPRLETILLPANFSSIVGEFLAVGIPKYCSGLVKNQHHNGHPDLIPADRFPKDAVQHSEEGIEVKASRYQTGWQGHNPENVWLMVFVFESNRPGDAAKSVKSAPFRFLLVAGARLTKDDWVFSGRSATSRRTITASVAKSGYEKMLAICSTERLLYKRGNCI